jgi:exodeoxyribonuclease VII large subunit
MQQSLLEYQPARRVYTVSELNDRIRGVLADFDVVFVSGEISGARMAPSGHWYFTLKDGESQLKCALFRMSARYLKFKPQDGMAAIARGRLDIYDARSEYQLIVEHLEPQGAGALQFAFEQLKKKLAEEGLFDAARKRPLPKFPRRIGIVTSPAGAVIQDILNILERRFPGLHIRLYPALVQGEGSVEQVCRGLRHFSESGWAEVVIVARGGGSLEDLWTFNEEAVARAIAASKIPVISAVGHETDFTIADFVADMRAATPSAAAELVICRRESLIESIEGCRRALHQRVRYRLSESARRLHEQAVDRAVTSLHRRIARHLQRLDELDRCLSDQVRRLMRTRFDRRADLDARLRRMDLRVRLAEARNRLGMLRTEGAQAMRLALARARGSFDPLESGLRQLSPLNVLERGYAIVQTRAGLVVKSPADAPDGTALRIRVANGEISAEVTPTGSSELPS